MKFIFDYVTCCMVSTPCNTDPPPSPRTEEETRSLVTSAPTRTDRRRRHSTSGVEWRPSLGAILEDKAVAVSVEKKKTESVRKQSPLKKVNVNRNSGFSGRVRAPTRSYDFRLLRMSDEFTQCILKPGSSSNGHPYFLGGTFHVLISPRSSSAGGACFLCGIFRVLTRSL